MLRKRFLYPGSLLGLGLRFLLLGPNPGPGSIQFYSRFRYPFRALGHRSGRAG